MKVIRVRVTDTASRPIARAEISVWRDMRRVSGGSADGSGQRTFRVPRDGRDYNIAVRFIGYERADRFFTAAGTDTSVFDVILHRVAQQLPAVEISQATRGRLHDYNIDADEIAKSSRYLRSVYDIIAKLRPMMFTSRAPGACDAATHADPLPALSNVWVNGQHIPIVKSYLTRETPTTPVFLPGDASAPSGTAKFVADAKAIRVAVDDVLTTIKPEHVAEMHYSDCLDNTMPKLDQRSAVFIVLKPGVEYTHQRGSFVSPPHTTHLAEGARSASSMLREMFPVEASDSRATLPPYRSRVIGVFDGLKNVPLDAVAVISDSLGKETRTTPSGAASLFFLPEGKSQIRVSKPGYRDTTFAVTISPSDTVPITVLLAVSDTSRKTPRRLQRVGDQQHDH